jgi:hypothetical protein
MEPQNPGDGLRSTVLRFVSALLIQSHGIYVFAGCLPATKAHGQVNVLC